jgi:hypothetical protein
MNTKNLPALALLLADPSPSLRLLVLRDLLGRSQDDAEVQELTRLQMQDPLVTAVASARLPTGGWNLAALPGSFPGGEVQAAAYALARLGFLGLDQKSPVVSHAAAFLFSQQAADGSWPLAETYRGAEGEEDVASMPLQTALPLAGLAACGYSQDPRAERGYEWLLANRLDDGAWPTGWMKGNLRGVAGYRRLPHSRWGCRSNTTAALLSLALHPVRRLSDAARRGLDLLLGRETHDRSHLGFETARLVGVEPPSGFLTYFARFDPALVLNLCWRMGASMEDMRIDDLTAFLRSQLGPHGLWEYPHKPQAMRWVSVDLLRSLARLDAEGEWVSQEPRTPFQPYPQRRRRY